MEGLTFDNIMTPEEIDSLFEDNETQETPPEQQEETDKETDKETTEIDTNDLFDGDQSESVGSEEEHQDEGKDTGSPKGKGTSPKNLYSSIAQALKVEGIFPDLDDKDIESIQESDDFKELFVKQIKAELDERQRRIDEALDLGVEPSVIRSYEGAINYLDSVNDEQISSEDEAGETLRKKLIMQDFMNRGYSKERAEREFNKSVQAGTDIEDAKEALSSNKEYFNSKYQEVIDNAKKEEEEDLKRRKKQDEELKTSILKDKELFGEINIDSATRKKIYDNISKPVYKDPESGQMMTAVMKYESEHPVEFIKTVGIIFTLTNGFTNFDNLVKTKARKEVKKGFRDLENVINSTARNSDGSLNFASGSGDSESSSRGWLFDV